MVIYEDYGTNKLGVELVRAYSDADMNLERDGVQYEEAIDPKELGRTYIEVSAPEEEATAEDYQEALQELGVQL